MTSATPGLGGLTRHSGEPRTCYARWREEIQAGEGLLLVDFTLDQYWLESVSPL